jgi:hypothetical protein
MIADQIYDDKSTKSYMKTQLKKVKKHQQLMTSEDILDNIRADIARRFNRIVPISNFFYINVDEENSAERIVTDVVDIMNKHYGDVDIALLYKFFDLGNAVVIQKKR